MAEREKFPDPDDVSVDYLYKPRPPAHEFHFRTKAMLAVITVVALVLGAIRFLLD